MQAELRQVLVIVCKRVSQQFICKRSQLGLNKNPFQEIPSMVRDVRRELGVGWLSGNFKDGSHGFELCPWGFLSEHFYHCATYTPETEAQVKQQVTIES